MNHPRGRGPRGRSDMNTQILERLDEIIGNQARIESKIDGSRRFAHSVARTELGMEKTQMAKFDALVARVRSIQGKAKSQAEAFKAVREELKKLSANMNDEEDQKMVDAMEAELAAVEPDLMVAIDENPLPTDPPVGGSEGGALPEPA